MPKRLIVRLGLLATVLTGLSAPAWAASAAPSAAGPLPAHAAGGAGAAPYVPGEVIVQYAPGTRAGARRAIQRKAGTGAPELAGDAGTQVLKIRDGQTVEQTLVQLRVQPGVLSAVPNYIAHATAFYPRDPGFGGRRGWMRLQWNFLGESGVGAPQAWTNVSRRGAPGGRGVTVAVLDTGVAYRRWGAFRPSPDFVHTHFVAPHDFVRNNSFALDRNGHGTHVAGTIAEGTNDPRAVTGLAYGARIMPVRVLDAGGSGDAATIARGIRYAASHGARVINMSFEFTSRGPYAVTSANEIPGIVSAIRYAHDRGVVIVAAAGNDADATGQAPVAYPARARYVIAVGATTAHRCRASYANDGAGIDLVAPGGGLDADLAGDRNCHPGSPPRHQDIFQLTLPDPRHAPGRFRLMRGWEGTSMAAPHVAATAALVIASRVIGRHPGPGAVERRLERTARDLGAGGHDRHYGWGLVDAARATASP